MGNKYKIINNHLEMGVSPFFFVYQTKFAVGVDIPRASRYNQIKISIDYLGITGLHQYGECNNSISKSRKEEML